MISHLEQKLMTTPSVADLLSSTTERGLGLWLAELYEGNYRLFSILCGSLRDLPERWVSRREGPLLCTLEAVRLGPYTTAIRYRFALPDLSVAVWARLYHDAKICEALYCLREALEPRGADDGDFVPALRRPQELSVAEKWAINHQFRRWLEYGLARDHFAARRLCIDPHALSLRQ
jgi:uncharacterized protein YqiB (DUF1249 family)